MRGWDTQCKYRQIQNWITYVDQNPWKMRYEPKDSFVDWMTLLSPQQKSKGTSWWRKSHILLWKWPTFLSIWWQHVSARLLVDNTQGGHPSRITRICSIAPQQHVFSNYISCMYSIRNFTWWFKNSFNCSVVYFVKIFK